VVAVLLTLTLVVNFLILAAALWLGLYVVTRSPRSLVAWLTGLTLWSITGLSLNILLALNPPPAPENLPAWVLGLLPFWQPFSFQSGASGWLQGWLLTPAIAFWHHATTVMRPGPMTPWRWARVVAGYLLAAAAVLIQLFTPYMFTQISGDLLYLNTLKTGPLFPYFAVSLLAFTGLSLANLVRSARVAPAVMPRLQLGVLSAATLAGGLAGPTSFVVQAFGLTVPRVVLSLLLGGAVVLIGYGVAQYSALTDGRVMQRDFYYNAVAVALVTILYLFVTWVSMRAYQVPAAAFIFVLMLAVVTHSLVDVARRVLDPIFFRYNTRRLRANLERLARVAGEQEGLADSLSELLASLCGSVHATYGLLITFGSEDLRLAAAYHAPAGDLPLDRADLTADDVQPLAPGRFPAPLTEAALLVPLYAEARQLGALLLGRPTNGVHYSQADLDLLLYPSDRLADAIRDAQREAMYVEQVARLLEANQPEARQPANQDSIKRVESALRNLSNYAYLGEHPMAEWKLVQQRLPAGASTYLDRGKVLCQVLSEAIEKLRPAAGRPPGHTPPREWHAYVILRDAYIENTPNRDIMSRLYISEGTFNRTRRAAIQALSRSLEQMEAALES
jgi:hypothetical protein